MSLLLTNKERKLLHEITEPYCKNRKRVKGGQVDPVTSKPEIDAFVEDFLARRNVTGEVTQDIGLYCFSHVGMHTDDIHGPDYWTLMIPVKGRGEFGYFTDGNDIYYNDIHDDGFYGNHKLTTALLFNDHKPHAFISKSINCYAVLVDIKADAIKHLGKT